MTGQSLGTFTRERFFEPLGMNQTLFYEDRKAIVPHRATGYAESDAGYEVDQYVNFAMGGDGQLFTTVVDLLLWHDYLYGDAADAAAVPSISDLMLTPGQLASGDMTNYAFGLFVEDFRGLKEIQHHGSWGGFRAYLARFQEESLSIAVLCNLGAASPWAAGHEIAATMLADRLAPDTDSSEASYSSEFDRVSDAAQLDNYTGRYEIEQLGMIYTIARDGSGLSLEQDGDTVTMQPVDAATFANDPAGLSVSFHSDANGRIERATLTASPGSDLRTLFNAGSESSMRRLVPWSPSPESLAAFAGSYYSPELETSYSVVIEDGGLLLRHPRRDDAWLEPKEENVFSGDYPFMSVGFERGENNRVMAFHVFAGGSQSVRFYRRE